MEQLQLSYSPREALFAVILVGLPIAGILFTLYMRAMLVNFRSKVKYIETRHQLNTFRRLATAAMYGSLFQLTLLFLPILVYIYALADGIFALSYVLLVVVPSGLYLLFYVRYKRFENRVQAMGMDNQELLGDFIHIVNTWRKKSLPRW